MLPHVLVYVVVIRLVYFLLVDLVKLFVLLHQVVELETLALRVVLGTIVHLALTLLLHNVEKVDHVNELLELLDLLFILLFLLYLLWIRWNISPQLRLRYIHIPRWRDKSINLDLLKPLSLRLWFTFSRPRYLVILSLVYGPERIKLSLELLPLLHIGGPSLLDL